VNFSAYETNAQERKLQAINFSKDCCPDATRQQVVMAEACAAGRFV
jgi:hypothetical protein